MFSLKLSKERKSDSINGTFASNAIHIYLDHDNDDDDVTFESKNLLYQRNDNIITNK